MYSRPLLYVKTKIVLVWRYLLVLGGLSTQYLIVILVIAFSNSIHDKDVENIITLNIV